MPIKVERRLFRIGEFSLAVTLPKPWLDYYGLKPGDVVEIIANDELVIRVIRQPSETTPEKADT